jgi:hypothetical protein
MKLDKLIEDLLAIQEELKSNDVDTSEVDVLAGIQPSYPLTGVVLGAISGEDLAEHTEELDENFRKAVWVATDQVSSYSEYRPYAPRPLWEALR